MGQDQSCSSAEKCWRGSKGAEGERETDCFISHLHFRPFSRQTLSGRTSDRHKSFWDCVSQRELAAARNKAAQTCSTRNLRENIREFHSTSSASYLPINTSRPAVFDCLSGCRVEASSRRRSTSSDGSENAG